MFLGIEIGGTKLQLGVGAGDGTPFAEIVRREVDRDRGAAGILVQIEQAGRMLLSRHRISAIGVGFGGPVDSTAGRVIKSHQVEGWDNFSLRDWCEQTLGLPASVANDCDAAALAEAQFGAGRGQRIVFFVTVGTGIGGGLVVDGKLHGCNRPAAAEIGHLRPGLQAVEPGATVESLASGPAIERAARFRLEQRRRESGSESAMRSPDDILLKLCDGDLTRITAKLVGEAASRGDGTARIVLSEALKALGWGIAQMVTLAAPEVVVVGGGVSLMGEEQFFQPLREEVRRYVFPPLADAYRVIPARLGEEVVVYGAVALAAGFCGDVTIPLSRLPGDSL